MRRNAADAYGPERMSLITQSGGWSVSLEMAGPTPLWVLDRSAERSGFAKSSCEMAAGVEVSDRPLDEFGDVQRELLAGLE